MNQEAKEYDFGYAIVRIHPGKFSEEERKEKIKNAAQQFYKQIHKDLGRNGCDVSNRIPVDVDVCHSV